jgi:hypothetical protein
MIQQYGHVKPEELMLKDDEGLNEEVANCKPVLKFIKREEEIRSTFNVTREGVIDF